MESTNQMQQTRLFLRLKRILYIHATSSYMYASQLTVRLDKQRRMHHSLLEWLFCVNTLYAISTATRKPCKMAQFDWLAISGNCATSHVIQISHLGYYVKVVSSH